MPTDPSPPLVSIGVPVYNGEKYLREALDSALAQDYAALEILISDNASTDGTEAIARDYVRRDPRVRYWRNPSNLGQVGNFGRVWAEARGRYFTWLACDDLLSSPRYLSETVAFLEANPDVVLCGCDLQILDIAGRLMPRPLPEIHPHRNAQKARATFFAYPQKPVCFAIYGMFRREALAAASFAGRTYRGQPVVTHMEYPILVPVLTRGRIIALPEFLRVYRWSPYSSWHRECDRLSRLDRLLLGLQTKWFLLRTAWRFPLPRSEKVDLVGLTLRNFVTFPLRTVRGEARRLRAAAEERRQLILFLRAEIDKRRDLLRRRGWDVNPFEPWPADLAADDGDIGRQPEDRRRWRMPGWIEPVRDAVEALWIDFFRPPSPRRQSEWRQELTDSHALLRVCEERLDEVHRLTAEAERCLVLLRSSPPGSRQAASFETTGAKNR